MTVRRKRADIKRDGLSEQGLGLSEREGSGRPQVGDRTNAAALAGPPAVQGGRRKRTRPYVDTGR
jgi:hypothetical protein